MISKPQSKLIFGLFLTVTIIEIINLFSGRLLNHFGIVPRELPGLTGVIFGPFLHGSLWHYGSNIIPLCLFSFLTLQYGTRRYLLISTYLIFSTGLLVWGLGRDAVHVGASGLIYGYFGFLVLAGFLNRKPKLIIISLLVGFFYGGLIFGVLPVRGHISWESHLFGFLMGLSAARFWHTPEQLTKPKR